MKSEIAVVQQGIHVVLHDRVHFMKFILASVAAAIASLFLMNFVSLPALINERELLFADQPAIENFVFLIVFSLLAGLAFALYSVKAAKAPAVGAAEGVTASLGGVFAMLTSACGICQPLLLFALGIPPSFAFLPLQGFEFRIASAGLLVSSIYLMSKSIVSCSNCVPAKR